ncbi:SIR2 family NAD-dependent protein deacylase [Roseateles amylovorans]|uniref:protein acetyllysine N-acetyltransferase n=1 Tax=Roseateles amylovorans TaxID=2978473 RepID=A0ABY6B1E6_9BURK|nr:Sir2 family NAD-dependent protein deacetylase [Roseateles amylovorans]UXH77809.1 NAD-dependent deacetylase [Roseateles amylovorans]
MSSTPAPELRAAGEWITAADALLIAAGAGMGVDSGLPDFRGRDGFWNAYPAMRGARLNFADAANPELFQRDPALAWGFYGHRLQLYRSTTPHPGFHILLNLGAAKHSGVFVFTSNVDGQFQKAGFTPDHLVECHGSIHHLQCAIPCSDEIWTADGLEIDIDPVACRWNGPLPRCPRCGSMARPNILMFSDGAWIDRRTRSQMTQLQNWLGAARNPVVIELGAGSAVPTVRNFSESIARLYGAKLVRINPDEYSVSPAVGVGVALNALSALASLRDEIYRN